MVCQTKSKSKGLIEMGFTPGLICSEIMTRNTFNCDVFTASRNPGSFPPVYRSIARDACLWNCFSFTSDNFHIYKWECSRCETPLSKWFIGCKCKALQIQFPYQLFRPIKDSTDTSPKFLDTISFYLITLNRSSAIMDPSFLLLFKNLYLHQGLSNSAFQCPGVL